LAQFHSTKELEASAVYRRLQPEIHQVLDTIRTGEFALSRAQADRGVRALAWNIERGIRTDGVIDAIRSHPQLKSCDVLMLSEVDHGMARTQNRFVARDIAQALQLNYAFAPCYLALNKGSGKEKHAAGDNQESLHGNALLSPH